MTSCRTQSVVSLPCSSLMDFLKGTDTHSTCQEVAPSTVVWNLGSLFNRGSSLLGHPSRGGDRPSSSAWTCRVLCRLHVCT